jgi:hypothetical protein
MLPSNAPGLARDTSREQVYISSNRCKLEIPDIRLMKAPFNNMLDFRGLISPNGFARIVIPFDYRRMTEPRL